ncbi:type VI secretion system baseplate subunit TssF [Roseateles amylovorans]|uniref:Type VI secretion system baseplate subunit TssF n=1 Tax=Roseateles amylovorans TaxID=2978473 RepID=A0ABY6AZC5_9BURK|nr:type VI secretion system baseplate subunit TssF [Roseateles amylovorans]UXH78521.1 type VI secretion system baseplate subunit TssF [Roseateles amylovorans]
MDARLLNHYNQELGYLRELGAEFAQAFPQLAGRLDMGSLDVADPYIERLLEGCAFLSARIHLKMATEAPRLSHRLLEQVYPHFTAPTPAMVVLQLATRPSADLLKGLTLPRDTRLFSPPVGAAARRCEFRTAQDTRLTPIQVERASLTRHLADVRLDPHALSALAAPPLSALRLQLSLPAGQRFDQLAQDRLRLYLSGPRDISARLHELLLTHYVGVVAEVGAGVAAEASAEPDVFSLQALRDRRSGLGEGAVGDGAWQRPLPGAAVRAVGLADDEALLPDTPAGFSGLRLLQESLTFPERLLFVDLVGLAPAFRRPATGRSSRLALVLLLSDPAPQLEGIVGAHHLLTNCVTAINLFPHRADRLDLHDRDHEHHVVPDRTAPLDFEVHGVQSVVGIDASGKEGPLQPLYGSAGAAAGEPAYSLRREPRLPGTGPGALAARSSYAGTEVFLAVVEGEGSAHPGPADAASTSGPWPGDTVASPRAADRRAVVADAVPPSPSPGSSERNWRHGDAAAANEVQPRDGLGRPSPAWRPSALALRLRCTNRDLPLFIPLHAPVTAFAPGAASAPAPLQEGREPLSTGFTVDSDAPLLGASVVAGPSRPLPATLAGDATWRLLQLLPLNYLSLLDTDGGEAASALRQMLGCLPQAADPAVRRQIDALQQVTVRPAVRRHPAPGPMAFARGLVVTLVVDELAHPGGNAFQFGLVMHQWLSRHVTMNSFVETVLQSLSRGEVARWAPRLGEQPSL